MKAGTFRLRVRVVREERGRPECLRNARVLVYWPHGLGDVAQLGYALPLLEPTNVWAFIRVGDDFISALDGSAFAVGLRTGVHAVADGDLGLPRHAFNGRRRTLRVRVPLAEAVRRLAPDAVAWPEFHDRGGAARFPFHTKARGFAEAFVAPERLAQFDLSRPLASGLAHDPPPEVQARVDDRLRELVRRGERLCVLVRGGRSDPLKSWGHGWRAELPAADRSEGSEVRAVAAALAADGWRILTFEDATLGAQHRAWPGADRVTDWHAFATGRLDDRPFATILKGVLRRAGAVIGVPAGPFHLAMARRDVPVVGVWLHQHPDWYEEPSSCARHVVGYEVVARGWDARAASRTRPPTWTHHTVTLRTRHAPADAVLAELRPLL